MSCLRCHWTTLKIISVNLIDRTRPNFIYGLELDILLSLTTRKLSDSLFLMSLQPTLRLGILTVIPLSSLKV